MSNYDVAVGLDEATLNKALAQLFGQAGVSETVASGEKDVDVPTKQYGIKWHIKAPPKISFAPVPQDRWQGAKKGEHDKDLPEDNVFTLVLPKIELTLDYKDGVIETNTTEANLFAQLRVADNKVTVDPYGLWVDKSQLDQIQIDPLESLVYFGLEMAEEALTDLALPAIPADLGVTLGPPTAIIHDHRRLVVAFALAPGQVNLEGVNWPEAGLFVLGSHELVNTLVRNLLPLVRGRTIPWRKEALVSPGGGGAAVVEAVAQVLEADAQVDATELTRVGGNARVALRASAVASGLKAIGLSALVRLLEKVYLAWYGLGYGAQVIPSQLYFRVGLALEDKSVRVQIQHVRQCLALLFPRGSLPTILLSLALWPLAQLVLIIVMRVLISRNNREPFEAEVFTIPSLTVQLLGKPLTVTAGELSAATHEAQLLIRGGVDLQ